jgi:hypothetical protein
MYSTHCPRNYAPFTIQTLSGADLAVNAKIRVPALDIYCEEPIFLKGEAAWFLLLLTSCVPAEQSNVSRTTRFFIVLRAAAGGTGQLRSLGGTESNQILGSALHKESHRKKNTDWLRTTVLGANDGLISTSSLVVGVAAAGPSHSAIMLTANTGQELGELAASPKAEHAEWASIP